MGNNYSIHHLIIYNDSYNVAERYDIPLLISGGINSIQDIKKIIKDNNKIEGVVVGKSIYENKIKGNECL